MKTRTIDGPQGRLAVDEAGSGNELAAVFLHADSGSRGHWRNALAHVGTRRRAVALDLRGHGDSDVPRNGDFSYAGRAEDISAVVDALDLRRFILVGHSGGAAVALAFANAHAERVAALLLVDPVTDPAAIPPAQRAGALAALAGPDYLAVITTYYSSIVGPNPQTAATVLHDVERTPQATIVGAMTALDALRPGDLVGHYEGPTLSIVLPANDMEHALHRTGRGFPCRHFPSLEVGHWFHLDDPVTFHAMLDAYFDEVARKA